MRAPRLALTTAVMAAVAVAVAAGPASPAADAKPKPKPKAEAVKPSSITLVVGKVRNERFGATGYLEFPERVTGTAYGRFIISNGLGIERVRFRLERITDTNYTPFTVIDRRVGLRGQTLTAVLVIGSTRSNRITLIQ